MTSEQKRIVTAKIIVAVGMVSGVLLSWPLWVSDRLYPVAPVLGLPSVLPGLLDISLLVITLLAVALQAIFPFRRAPTITAIVGCVLLAILDKMRWQPWFYQYVLCLLALVWVAKDGTRRETADALATLRMIVAAIYLWSGIHKCRKGFIEVYSGDLARPMIDSFEGWVTDGIEAFAFVAGPIEASIGILLIFSRSRMIGVSLACTMHLLILIAFSPLFQNRNSVIWPWNFCMIAMVVTLFVDGNQLEWRMPRQREQRFAAGLIGILVIVMPALSIGEWWPKYFSFHLYSGQDQRFQMVMTTNTVANLPPAYSSHLEPSPAGPGYKIIDFNAWAMRELNAPLVSEPYVLLQIGKEMNRRLQFDERGMFFYRDYPNYLEERGWDQYSPGEIDDLIRFPSLKHAVATPTE
jgi:uncharacterized membrane protein YphA (DoxX/SURF4 family)